MSSLSPELSMEQFNLHLQGFSSDKSRSTVMELDIPVSIGPQRQSTAAPSSMNVVEAFNELSRNLAAVPNKSHRTANIAGEQSELQPSRSFSPSQSRTARSASPIAYKLPTQFSTQRDAFHDSPSAHSLHYRNASQTRSARSTNGNLSASRPPTATPDPSVIQALYELDLANEERAFSVWLDRKKRERNLSRATSQSRPLSSASLKRTQPLRQPTTDIPATIKMCDMEELLVNPNIAKNLTSDQVDALIRRLERNRQTFSAWLDRKTKEEEQRRKAEQEAQAKADAEKLNNDIKKKRMELISKRRVSEWRKMKDDERAKLELEKEQARVKQMQEEKQRRMANRTAFRKWLDSHRANANALQQQQQQQQTVQRDSRPMWVDLINTQQSVQNDGSLQRPGQARKRSKSTGACTPLLSPPNLYKDYARTQALAPDYLRKYGVQVASGGIGLTMDEAMGCAPPRPSSAPFTRSYQTAVARSTKSASRTGVQTRCAREPK